MIEMTSTIEEARISSVPPPLLDESISSLLSLPMPDATELILVRHGHADYSAASQDDPWDPALSPIGREQAERLAARISSYPCRAIYASPMRRAQETAGVIARLTGLPVSRAPGLQEVDVRSVFTTEAHGSEPSRQRGELIARLMRHPTWDALPGCEPSWQFRRRVSRAIKSISAQHQGQQIVIVTHLGVINAYLSMILGIPKDIFFLPDNTSINVVRASGEIYTVRCLNDCAHLSSSSNGHHPGTVQNAHKP